MFPGNMIRVSLVCLLLGIVSAQNDTSVEVNDTVERVKKAEDTATIVATTTMSPEKLKETKEAEIRKLQEVKNELDRAVQSLNSSTAVTKTPGPVIALAQPGLQSCTPLDCNNRGTCLGTRTSYLCACQFGFSGRSCEETMCDSVRDCNGRGICLGTSANVQCLCNLGYGGPRCETAF